MIQKNSSHTLLIEIYRQMEIHEWVIVSIQFNIIMVLIS